MLYISRQTSNRSKAPHCKAKLIISCELNIVKMHEDSEPSLAERMAKIFSGKIATDEEIYELHYERRLKSLFTELACLIEDFTVNEDEKFSASVMTPAVAERIEYLKLEVQKGPASDVLAQDLARTIDFIKDSYKSKKEERIRREGLEMKERIRKEDMEVNERIRREDMEMKERIRKEDMEVNERIRREDMAMKERIRKEEKGEIMKANDSTRFNMVCGLICVSVAFLIAAISIVAMVSIARK
jgi:hypothetical protein